MGRERFMALLGSIDATDTLLVFRTSNVVLFTSRGTFVVTTLDVAVKASVARKSCCVFTELDVIPPVGILIALAEELCTTNEPC